MRTFSVELMFPILIVLLLALVPSGLAVDLEPEGTMSRKLQRAFLNVALAPIEISYELKKARLQETAIPNWFIGTLRGGFAMVGRMIIGIYELVTFPIPIPKNYEPVIYPEFAWQHLDVSE